MPGVRRTSGNRSGGCGGRTRAMRRRPVRRPRRRAGSRGRRREPADRRRHRDDRARRCADESASSSCWRTIEPEPGIYDFSSTDAIAEAARGRGVALVPFVYGSPTVDLGRREPSADRPSRRAVGWRNAARGARRPLRAAAAASGPGSRAQSDQEWQIWNEPNFRLYWEGQPSARGYARLLRISARRDSRRRPRRDRRRGRDRADPRRDRVVEVSAASSTACRVSRLLRSTGAPSLLARHRRPAPSGRARAPDHALDTATRRRRSRSPRSGGRRGRPVAPRRLAAPAGGGS